MKRVLPLIMMAWLASGVSSAFAQADPVYPFKVKIGGKEAIKKSPSAVFAVIEQAVAPDAEVEVAAQGQVIVNVFPADAKGNPQAGAAPAILIFQAPKTSLAKTTGGKKLGAGNYLANVVAGGATSRVMFTVK